MSWNVEVDYARFYTSADPAQKRIVRDLYASAGLRGEWGVRADLARIDGSPRTAADPDGVEYWRAYPRTLSGSVQVPLVHIHSIGDSLLPHTLMAGYEAAVHQQGKAQLYRQAFVEAAGHCTLNVAEIAAAVDTMIDRLDTGRWEDSTRPSELNAAGRSFGVGEPRFISHHLPPRHNRAFLVDSQYPAE